MFYQFYGARACACAQTQALLKAAGRRLRSCTNLYCVGPTGHNAVFMTESVECQSGNCLQQHCRKAAWDVACRCRSKQFTKSGMFLFLVLSLLCGRCLGA